jgi:hypothetical protein
MVQDQNLAMATTQLNPVGAENASEPWLFDERLVATEVERNTAARDTSSKMADTRQTAKSLAATRRTLRLLWIALIISLIAHLVIPVWIATVMERPEKVALMDGTETLIVSPLVPVEQSNEILETISLWAAKSFLDRGPQGFDASDTLDRVFLPAANKKAREEFKKVADEFAKKNIHQKVEVGRIDLQRLDGGTVLSHVVGQILTQAQVGDEQITEPRAVALNFTLTRNPYLGRNKRYPFAVSDFSFGEPEQLQLQKRDEK